jgi:hypothetical protein
LFVVPVVVYALVEGWERRRILGLAAVAVVTGAMAYAPALLDGGLLVNPYVSIRIGLAYRILSGGYRFLALFGLAQSAILIPLVGVLLWRQRSALASQCGFFAFHLGNIVLWLALFAVMPDEPEYMMPLVPSVIMLLDRLASRRVFLIMAVTLLSFHFVQFDVLGGQSGMRRIRPSLRPGATIEDIRDRVFKLSLRTAATEHRVSAPTVLMLGASWIPVGNDAWVDYQRGKFRAFKQRNGELYVSDQIRDESVLRDLRSEGFSLLVWNDNKAELVLGSTSWRDYVDVINELDAFFHRPIRGKALSVR